MRKLALAGLLIVAHAHVGNRARAWPDRPIKFIVHVAAGGGVDLNARILADRLNQQLPQRVLIENMGGAGGAIAARAVAKAEPDGYTFLFAGPGHAAVPFMHKQAPYDPIKRFHPGHAGDAISAGGGRSIRTCRRRTCTEFIALAKAEPGKHTFGSSGVGGSSHIPAEMLMRQRRRADDPRAVPRQRPVLGGAARRPDRHDHRRARAAARQHRRRAASACLASPPRSARRSCPTRRPFRRCLPGYQFPMWVGAVRAGQDAEGDRRPAGRRGRQGDAGSGDAQALRRRQGRARSARRRRNSTRSSASSSSSTKTSSKARTSSKSNDADQPATGSSPRIAAACRARRNSPTCCCARRPARRIDEAQLHRECAAAVAAVLDAQLKAGIDIVSDGEQPRVGFSMYVPLRMEGFGGETIRPSPRDLDDFPLFAERLRAEARTPQPHRQSAEGGRRGALHRPADREGRVRPVQERARRRWRASPPRRS